jgi:predicted metal-dependent peptidase
MNLPDRLDSTIESAHTNGREIAWSPTFVDGLTDEEIRYVLLHETLHCAHQHMWRLPIDKRGNEAGDHEINLTLNTLQGIKMPEGGLADPQYEGLACEDILGRLQEQEPEQDSGGDDGESGDDEQDQDSESGAGTGDSESGSGDESQDDGDQGEGQGDGQGSGDAGGASDPCGTFGAPQGDPGDSAAAQAQADQELRDDWESRVMQAAQAAQALGVGDVPADLQRILDKIRHQSVDWRAEMADFVKDSMSQRNDWSRSTRRHAWQPVIYPRKQVDQVGTIVFVRDTSGSINDKVCAEFTSLVNDCVGEMDCHGIVYDCDAHIQAEYDVYAWQPCPFKAKGGGGTRFQPVFDKVDELVAAGEVVAGIVYLTDMASYDLQSLMSEIPTLWLSHSEYGDVQPPFGRKVKVEL